MLETSSSKRWLGYNKEHAFDACHDHSSICSTNVESNGHDFASIVQDREHVTSQQPIMPLSPSIQCQVATIGPGQVIGNLGLPEKIINNDGGLFDLTLSKGSANHFLQSTLPKANQKVHLALQLNTRHVVAQHALVENHNKPFMIHNHNEPMKKKTSNVVFSKSLRNSLSQQHSVKPICLISQQVQRKQVEKYKVSQHTKKYTSQSTIIPLLERHSNNMVEKKQTTNSMDQIAYEAPRIQQVDVTGPSTANDVKLPSYVNNTADIMNVDVDMDKSELGAFTNLPSLPLSTNPIIMDPDGHLASQKPIIATTAVQRPEDPLEITQLHSGNAVASSSKLTLEELQGHEHEDIRSEAVSQQELQSRVQQLSKALFAICNKATELSEVFGDTPTENSKLLEVLKEVDQMKNWITMKDAQASRIARAVKQVMKTYRSKEEQELAVRIMNNFVQRFTTSDRRFKVRLQRRSSSSERDMQE